MSDSPLILFLIVKLLELIGYLCSIICLPIILYCKLVILVCNDATQDNIKNSKSVHFLMFLPRALIVLPFFPFSFLGLSYLYGWAVSHAIPNHASFLPWVLAAVALVVNIIGFVFTRFKFQSMKDFKFGEYYKSVWQSILDIGAMFAFILSVVTVIRIPFLFGTFNRTKPIRRQLYYNMFLIIPDIICVPLLLLQCIFFWRMINLVSLFKTKKINLAFGFRARLMVMFESLKIFWDVAIIIFLPVLILLPYHAYYAIEKIKTRRNSSQPPKVDECLGIITRRECLAVLDLLLAIFFVFTVVITVYRLYHAIKRAKQANRGNDVRAELFFQCLYVFADIWILFCGIFITVSVYRLVRAISKMKSPHNRWNRYREYVTVQFIRLLRDIPFIFMGLFVSLLVWRAFFMLRDVFQKSKKSERRQVVLYHFGMLFVDIIDTPFLLASILILVSGWRSYFFVKGFPRVNSTRMEQRKYVFKNFVALLLDIPATIALLVILVTIYRAKPTITQLKHYFKYKKEKLNNDNMGGGGSGGQVTINNFGQAPPLAMPSQDDEDNPAPKQSTRSQAAVPDDIKGMSSWRMIVGKQLFLLIIDIPIPILLLLTLWRLPILVKRLKEIDDPERSYSQRRLLILRYLWYIVLDIICSIPLALILITVWRIPTFVAMVKKYKRGDNEHLAIALIFTRLIVDIPFVILGILTFVFPWRGIFLVKSVYKDCKTDKEARWTVLEYALTIAIDTFNIILSLIILTTLWRVPTLIYCLKMFLSRDQNIMKHSKWFHTNSITKSTVATLTLWAMDILLVIQLVCILLIGIQVYPMIKFLSKISKGDLNFGFEDLRHPVSFFFLESLRDIPHIVLLPLKAVGIIFYPVHLYLKKRTKNTTTQSFLKLIVLWIHELSENEMNFYGFDKFATINLLGALVIIPNEIGVVLVLINSIYMFIVTLGSPLWNQFRTKYEWTELGTAIGPLVILEYITVILQALLFPVFVAMQILLLLLPIIISLAAYYPTSLSFNQYWDLFFSSRAFWKDTVGEFGVGIWFIQAFWVLVMAVTWHINYLVAKRYFPLFSPWKAYYWLIKKLFVGRFWGLYKLLLSKPTNICYRLRRVCMVGELLMFPLFLIWTCWPLIPAIVTKVYYSYFIIRDSWGEPVVKDETPKIALTGVFVNLPDDGGLVITFSGYKPYGFSIQDARLSLEGDAIWKAIEKAIGKTKLRAALMIAGYPITLCPMFFNVSTEINDKPTGDIEFSIRIGVAGSKMQLKKKILTRTLDSIVKVADPTFDFVVEYGKQDFGWKKLGVLCRFNTSLSIILDAGNDNSGDHSLTIGEQQHLNPNIPIPPPQPTTNNYNNNRVVAPTTNNNTNRVVPTTTNNQQHHLDNYQNSLYSSFDRDLQLAIELSKQDQLEEENRILENFGQKENLEEEEEEETNIDDRNSSSSGDEPSSYSEGRPSEKEKFNQTESVVDIPQNDTQDLENQQQQQDDQQKEKHISFEDDV
ncbi:Polyprotein [Cavenderia fasciculata]|uniref:Polyprotein n=1 Tax=Cavenderia fasciculata TaxID=261658 RepID=F4PXC6_CACFS|nr:Polyprotein [Cavenderia fasciculata]EGG19436.1 Polyprotein [Cavenderia fasciculata]|eukprot:XP_004357730.1 Polyprotein [Cavenderia fasciculata]